MVQMLSNAPRLRCSYENSVTAAAPLFEPLLEFEVVPRTVAVLGGIRLAFQHLNKRGGGGDGDGLAFMTSKLVADALALLEMCAGIVLVASTQGSAARGLQIRLLEQLAADEAVCEVARVPGFVQQHLWPLAAASERRADGGTSASPGAGAAPHASQQGAQRAPLGANRNNIFKPRTVVLELPTDDPGCFGCLLLGSLASYASNVVETAAVSRISEAVTRPSGSQSWFQPVAPEVQQVVQRFLGSLAESGLMASLSAALLAAPPWPDVAPDAEEVHPYTKAIALLQRKALTAVLQLAYCDTRAHVKPLLAPEVRRLQWELLEQVAATAEDGAAALQRRQRWPLLQRHALRLIFGPSLQINEVMHDCVAATTEPGPKLRELVGLEGAIAFIEGTFPARGPALALGARVCAALHARLQLLGSAGAQPRQGVRVTPQKLINVADEFRMMLMFRLGCATKAEQAACLPDLLALVAWVVAMYATPAGLHAASRKDVAGLVCALSIVLQGTWFNGNAAQAARGELATLPEVIALTWSKQSPGVQSACLRRLLPTDLPRALDRLIRHVAAAEGGSALQDAALLHVSLVELIGPLLRAGLVRWRVVQQVQRQQQVQMQVHPDQEQQDRPSAAAEGVAGGWRAEVELGLALTALKLLRREAGLRDQDSTPELLASDAPFFALACFVLRMGGTVCGLPSLVQELLKAPAVGRNGGGGAEGPDPGAADVATVAQAMAACSWEGLRHLTPLLEEAAAAVEGREGGRALGADPYQLYMRLCAVADALAVAVAHAPPEMLLQAQPQRTLAAIGRLLAFLQQQQQRQGRPAAVMNTMLRDTKDLVAQAVLLLAADERLQERCVPGWVWVEKRRGPGGASQEGLALNEAALASVRGPGYAPRTGPVLTMAVGGAVMARFSSRRWAQHGQHVAELAELAGERVEEMMDSSRAWKLAAAALAGGEAELWPPRRLRLCGNPGCGNFGGASEAELELKKCARCRAVRYCSAACQRQHWPAHKADCAKWAGEAAGAAGVGGERDGA